MVSFTKLMFTIVLVITLVLGIVGAALALHAGADDKRVLSLAVLGIVFFLVATIMYIVLMLKEPDQYKVLMIVDFVLVVVGLVCISAVAGLIEAGRKGFTDWYLSAVWSGVIATIMALFFVLMDPNNMA